MPVNFDLADEEQDAPDDFTPEPRSSFEPASAPSYAGVDYALAQRKPKRLPKFDTPDFDPRRAAEEYLAPDASEEHAKAQFYAERGFDPVVDAVGRVVPRGTKFGSDGRADLEHLGELDAGVNETPTVRAQMRLQQLQARNDAAAAREQRRTDAINERLRQQTADAPRVMAERAHAEAGHANAEEAKHRIALARFDKSPDGKELKSLVADNPDDASYLNQTAPGGGAAFGDTSEPRTPVEVPIEVQDRMARVDALRQTRDRLAKAHQEAAGKATAAQMRAQALADERDGIVRQPEPVAPDPEASTRPDVHLADIPETDAEGRQTVDSLVRMKNKAAELQATLDGAGGNLAAPVRARLKAQISALNAASEQGVNDQTDEGRKAVSDATRAPTIGEDLTAADKAVARGAATGATDILGGALNLSLLAQPGGAATLLSGLSPVDDAVRAEKKVIGETYANTGPERVKRQLDEGLLTNAVPGAVGGLAPYLVGGVAGAGGKAAGLVVPGVMGALGMGQSTRDEAEKLLGARRDKGEITEAQYQKGVAQATALGGIVGTAMAVPFGGLAKTLAKVPAGRTFLDVLLTKLGTGGEKEAADWVATPIAKKLLSGAAKASEDGLVGAATGFGQSVASNASASGEFGNVAYDPHRGFTDGASESALSLGLVSALHGALMPHNGPIAPRGETPPADPNNPAPPAEPIGAGLVRDPDGTVRPAASAVPLAPMPPAIDKPARITEMLAQGHTPAEVAAEVGVPLADVHDVRDARGIPSADDPAALEAWKLANEDSSSRNENAKIVGPTETETNAGARPSSEEVAQGAPQNVDSLESRPVDEINTSPPSPLAVADITPNEVSAEATAAPKPKKKYYRETSAQNALDFIDKDTSSDLGQRDVFLAEAPELALGQGGNKGVMLEFEGDGLQTRANRSKPGTEFAQSTGQPIERIGINSQEQYQKSLSAFTYDPQQIKSAFGIRLRRIASRLEKEGWKKSIESDGRVRLEKPTEAAAQPNLESTPVEPVAIGDRGTPEEQTARNMAMLAEQKRLVDEHLAATKPEVDTPAEPTESPATPVQDSSVAERLAHNQEATGSTPVPASSEPEGTGIKNASVAEMRESMGAAPSKPREGTPSKEMHAEAIARVEADPDAGSKLVKSLADNPRQVSGPEAVLLSHEITRINNKVEAATKDLVRATAEGDEGAQALAIQARAEAQAEFDRADEAAGYAKTKWSDVGRALQLKLKSDFSLANITRQRQLAKGAEPLTEAEHAKIQKEHGDYEELQKKYDELTAQKAQSDAERDANNALLKFANDAARERNAPPKARRSVLDSLIERGDAATARIRAKMRSGQTRSSVALGLEDAHEYAQVVAGHIARGIRTASALTARLLKDFGEGIRPHIPQILKLGTDEHARSVAALAATGRDAVIERQQTVAKLKERMAAGEPISNLGGLVREVIDQHLAEGVKFRDGMTDAVDKTLKEADPSISRSDTLAAISDAQRTDRAIRSLDAQINQLNAQLRTETVFGAGKPRPIHSTEVEAKRAELGALKEQREYLRQRLNPRDYESEAKQKDLARIEKATTALKEKLAREDYSKRPKPPERELDKQVLEAKTRLDMQKEKLLAGQRALELANRTKLQKFGDGVKEALNLPRSVLSSWDLSAVLRQGGFISVGNPARAAKSIMPMLRSLRSDFQAHKVDTEIKSRENAPLYKKSGLYFAPMEKDAPLSSQEEQIMSKLARNLPGVRASNRAFVTYLNKLRADSFDQMKDGLIASGKEPTKEELNAISNYINVATGRGSLGVKNAAAAETLASIFFSPRLAASRFQLLFGQPTYGGTARTRTQVAKEYAKFALGLSAIYGLGALAGGKMEDDPRSSDFGKLRFGNTRIDPLVGVSQVAALLSKLFSGSRKTADGKIVPIRDTNRFPQLKNDPKTGKPPVVPYGSQNAYDVMASFARSKLSPIVGAGVDTLTGKDFAGQPVTPAQTAANLVTPLPFSGVTDIYKEQGGAGGSAIELLNLLGMGVQHYEPPKKKTKP